MWKVQHELKSGRMNIELSVKDHCFAERIAYDCIHNPFDNELGADFIGDGNEEDPRRVAFDVNRLMVGLLPEQAFLSMQVMFPGLQRLLFARKAFSSTQHDWHAIILAVLNG
jgi:hypothetical protein